MRSNNAQEAPKKLSFILSNVAALLLEMAFAYLSVGAWLVSSWLPSVCCVVALVATLDAHVHVVARTLVARDRQDGGTQGAVREPAAAARAAQTAVAADGRHVSPAQGEAETAAAKEDVSALERADPAATRRDEGPSEARAGASGTLELAPASAGTGPLARSLADDPRPPARHVPSVAARTPRKRRQSTLDLDALSNTLVLSADPLAELRLFVGDVRTREAEHSEDAPSPFERFACRMLEEAGLFATDVELPELRVVRLHTSKLFYLRIATQQLPYLAKTRVLALEAALNALCLSKLSFDDPDATSVEGHYQLTQRLARSICAQSPNLSEHVPVIEDDHPDTEWAVRLGISTAIETLQLPHRLVASWRVNVADGNVGIQLELVPESVFPKTAYVDGFGLVPSSREMRRREASAYALRLALLVAACAFRCSERIHHVWVAGIVETATRRDCRLSVDFDRWRFSQLDLKDLDDLKVVYRRFVPQMRLEEGILRPVRQGFYLDEPRFCPIKRYENVGLSRRRLADDAARALGTDHVAGLAINESDKRELIATDIMRHLTHSTEENVKAIIELAADDPDPSVRSAAERTIGKLIDGTLADDPLAVGEEFVAGDALSRANAEAQRAFLAQDVDEAARILRRVLDPIDSAGIYADSPTVEWRYFPSYVNRAMYNRLCATEGRTLMLVPDAYFEAHLMLSAALLTMGQAEQALAHARRLVELSPLDARARLHATRCLETLERMDEAVDMLSDLLVTAHDPHSLGLGYYRMAFFQWRRGNYLAAQACYQKALTFMPGSTPMIAMEMATLALQSPGSVREELSSQEVDDSLHAVGVPIAPTETISKTFLDAARASLNAEIFPVARGFVNVLGAFSGDDILVGLIRSIEEEPDV